MPDAPSVYRVYRKGTHREGPCRRSHTHNDPRRSTAGMFSSAPTLNEVSRLGGSRPSVTGGFFSPHTGKDQSTLFIFPQYVTHQVVKCLFGLSFTLTGLLWTKIVTFWDPHRHGQSIQNSHFNFLPCHDNDSWHAFHSIHENIPNIASAHFISIICCRFPYNPAINCKFYNIPRTRALTSHYDPLNI